MINAENTWYVKGDHDKVVSMQSKGDVVPCNITLKG